MGHPGSTTTQVVSTVFRELVHQILEKNQEQAILSMAKQDGEGPYEAQPNSSLSVPPRTRAQYRGLKDFVEPLGAIS